MESTSLAPSKPETFFLSADNLAAVFFRVLFRGLGRISIAMAILLGSDNERDNHAVLPAERVSSFLLVAFSLRPVLFDHYLRLYDVDEFF